MTATTEVQETEPARPWLPWLTHVLAAISIFPWLVGQQIYVYGLERTSAWSLTEPMGATILIPAVVIAVPFGAVEAWAARKHRMRWWARAAAVLGTSVVTWFAGLPVVLRFFGSTDPVTQREVESAVTSYLILMAAYLSLVVMFRSIRRPRRLRATTARA